MRMPFLNIVSLPLVSLVGTGYPAVLSPIGLVEAAVVDKFSVSRQDDLTRRPYWMLFIRTARTITAPVNTVCQ